MVDHTDLTATAAADAMRRGDITSVELVGSCLDRIAAREPEVGAFAFIDTDHALAQARASDATRREGKGVGPLHGMPVGIKDIIDTADLPTEHGSPIFAGRRPTVDAACVAALRDAGAIIIGKTVTTELATLTPAKTRNPNNLAHTPGGSSSGSAAGVAAGMFPLALATQTGGSVIRPASFCGIYGIKPTFGLISRTGVLMQSHTLDTVGVYGRSIDDLALGVDVLSAHDPRDPGSYPRSRPSLLATSRQPVPLPPLFAFVKTPAWDTHGDPRMHAAFAELVEALGRQAEELPIETLSRATEWGRIVQGAENIAYYGHILEQAPGQVSPGLTDRLNGGRKIDARSYIDAIRGRDPAYGVIEEILTSYTAILTPASPGPAPLGLASTGNPVFNLPWTYLGVPCVTLPLLEAGSARDARQAGPGADGANKWAGSGPFGPGALPIGVQLVGQRRDDGRLLRTARWLVDFVTRLES